MSNKSDNPETLGVPQGILSLDCSFTTGWAAQLGGVLHGSGVVAFKDKKNPALRYTRFSEFVNGVLDQGDFDLIVHEKPHLRGYGASLALCGMITRVQEIAAHRGIPVMGVHSAEIKSMAGRGNASKEYMRNKAAEVWPHYYADGDTGGDEADALWLLEFARKNIRLA